MSVASIANHLIDKYNYKSYLEIGIHRGKTFKRVQCDTKVGVDPGGRKRWGIHPTHAMTSDDYFANHKDYFDIVFIDGLHHADQFMRDVDNSLDRLNTGGVILCHDVNPTLHNQQVVPWLEGWPLRKGWLGDVWKSWVRLRATREDLWMCVIEGGVGLGVIRKGEQELLPLSRKLILPTYSDLDKNRKEWLNLVTWDEFENIL
jgi:hypothetical protein